MFSEIISPRFCETDALGHVNNTVLPVWFEKAREPLFRLFTPDMSIADWRLIIARIEVEFKAQLHYGRDVEVRTWLEKMGNSSMTVTQEAWQNQKLCAKGAAVMIHFDYEKQRAISIPDDIRQSLSNHLQTA